LVSPQPATAQEPTAQSSDAQPRAISVVQPNYSERARTAGIEGTVLLEVLIGADGHVKNAEIREGLDPDLDENALAAVRQWRFEPGTPDRQPVRTTVQMNFKLDGLRTGVVGGVPGGVIGGVPGGVIGGVPGGVITEVVSASPQDQRVYDAHEKGVTMPKVMYKVDAKYSQAARDAGVEGTVVVYVEVAPDGRAHNMHIERGLHADLDKNTLDAISNWRFKPATKDGKPVTVHATVETNFRLK
jgi:TonB family protein